MKNVLVIAVHPDDETIGCGGTLLKLKAFGCNLHWLIGTTANELSGYSLEFSETRKKQINIVKERYNFVNTYTLNIPTAKVDNVHINQIILNISSIIKNIEPDTIFLPFFNDIHSDHRIFFNASYSCTKTFRSPSLKRIYMMETLSETEFAPSIPGLTFTPNTFVNISQYIEEKIDILKIYQTEVQEHPFPRSVANVMALATHRGATSGCNYAESFMLLKEVW